MSSRGGPDVTAALISRIKSMIAEGALQPGVRLPTERDFARQLTANRASVRLALKALEVIGVVRQRVGDGTYLSLDASSTLSTPLDFLLLVDGITFGELFEARRIFEPELAARAASRHGAEEIRQLEATVAEMRSHFESGFLAGVASCDQRFHRLIWQMAGNRVCLRMFVPLHRIMTNRFAMTWSVNDYESAVGLHSDILEAVRNADASAARQQMSEHLRRSELILLRASGRTTEVPAVASQFRYTEIHTI